MPLPLSFDLISRRRNRTSLSSFFLPRKRMRKWTLDRTRLCLTQHLSDLTVLASVARGRFAATPRNRSWPAEGPGAGTDSHPSSGRPSTDGCSNTVASGPASPGSSAWGSTAAFATRYSCTPPRCWLAPSRTGPPRLGRTTRLRPGSRGDPTPPRGSVRAGGRSNRLLFEAGPTSARPSPDTTPHAARPSPVARASGPGTPCSADLAGSSPTVFHSGPLNFARDAVISDSARLRLLSRPSASNRSSAALARPHAVSWPSTSSNVWTARRQAAAAALATPRASRPCRFEVATRASLASALAHAASALCQARWSTPLASRAVGNRSRPWANGVVSSANRLCRATPSSPEAIPWAASETANSRATKGASCRCQLAPLRSAELWQKTAVRLAGSIPTRIGCPPKKSRPRPG
jgi:hypothetical protein